MRNKARALAMGSLAAVLGVSALAAAEESTRGGGDAREPVLATPHFAFYSDFETNLNDALINNGLARTKQAPELFRVGDEASCFDALPPSERTAWDAAVDYYQKVVSPVGFSARQQVLLRMQLVGFEAEWRRDRRAIEFVEIARHLRAVAAPAYRACRWSTQDERNRRWLEELRPRLADDEEATAARIQALYQTSWKALPVLVDVVETVDWSGANSTWSAAGQGDVLITSAVGGAAAFETLIHESSHVLMGHDSPVRQALARAATAAGVELPRDLWHVVLFYTTGEAVRPIVTAREGAPYTPMLYEIFERSSWKQYREALEREWLPYVEGKRSLDEAAAGLTTALPVRDEAPGE